MSYDNPDLLGFSDFFTDEHLGVAASGGRPAPHGVKPKASKGKGDKNYPPAKKNEDMQRHGKVLKKAHGVATKAVSSVMNAVKLLHAPASTVRSTKGIATPPLATNKPVHLGAAAAAVMSPKQHAAVAKHNAAVAKAKQAAKVLAQHAIATKKAVKTLTGHMVNQKKVAIALRKGGKGRVSVGELLADPVIGDQVREAFEDYYTKVGADPDPANPGYLTDGSPDPAAATGTTPTGPDPTTGDLTSGLSDPSLDPTGMDSGATLPPAPDMTTFTPDMTMVGGIAYNGAKGTPEGYIVSYGLATRATDHYVEPNTVQIDGTEHWGYVFGRYDMLDPPNGGIPWGSNLQSGAWNHVHGRYHLGDSAGWHTVVDASEAFASNSKSSDRGVQYGPLVGNPALKDFARMRVDGKGQAFWFPQEAPDWLTFPIKQAAALTAQAAAKAAADAAKADAAAAAKAAADAAAAQTAQDAANALAESAATSQANVQQTQTAAQAAADQAASEQQASQALIQQQQADTSQEQLDIEQSKQAGDIMVQQAQRAAKYYEAHPEEEFAPVEPEDSGDAGGDDLNSDVTQSDYGDEE